MASDVGLCNHGNKKGAREGSFQVAFTISELRSFIMQSVSQAPVSRDATKLGDYRNREGQLIMECVPYKVLGRAAGIMMLALRLILGPARDCQ